MAINIPAESPSFLIQVAVGTSLSRSVREISSAMLAALRGVHFQQHQVDAVFAFRKAPFEKGHHDGAYFAFDGHEINGRGPTLQISNQRRFSKIRISAKISRVVERMVL
jgi:hypothetical protein